MAVHHVHYTRRNGAVIAAHADDRLEAKPPARRRKPATKQQIKQTPLERLESLFI